MLESHDYVNDTGGERIEYASMNITRTIDSLSPEEFCYLNEVRDISDVYALRLEELGILGSGHLCCVDGKFNNSTDSYPDDFIDEETETGQDYAFGTPLDSERGQWSGDRGNSSYVFNTEAKPSSKNYGNLKDQTFAEMGKELGDDKPQVEFIKGNPVFNRDAGTLTGRPLEVKIEEGIGKYLNQTELENGGKVNREQLHTEAFNRMAEKYGVSVDELKVFKGDSAPVSSLSEKWNCSESEVWERCGNPNHIQRVLHEEKDQMTIQLVPRMYHDNVTHCGGIEEATKDVKEGK